MENKINLKIGDLIIKGDLNDNIAIDFGDIQISLNKDHAFFNSAILVSSNHGVLDKNFKNLR